LRVPCLGIDKDFADKLYRPLHRVGLTDILSLCDEDRADHIGGCVDVQQESFLIGWSRHHWRRGKGLLKLF